jgi:isoleucyl-tRNA synthetase
VKKKEKPFMDYKDTLLLPKTTFPMRGNLPQNEPKRYKKWFSDNLYQKMKQNRVGKEEYNLHDGPPYANGHIHIGHALNKILKDIIVKFNYFQGKSVRYVPGWDCHGLPIEQQVEKKIGTQKKEQLPKSKIRELCREHAAKFIEIQKEEFQALGVIGDWENPYKTMDFKFEANIYKELTKIAKRGFLIERSKPVFWCMHDKTALAEAEVEYKDKEDYSIYVSFKLKEPHLLGLEEASIVIWTTTPWTLPANMGISLSPDEEYAVSEDNKIVALALYDTLKEAGVVKGEPKKVFKASILEKAIAINPLNNRESIVLLGNHVTTDGGTGCVHTAPGHGEDDYRVWLKYGFSEVIQPVDEKGCYLPIVKTQNLLPDEFVGEFIFKAQPKILEILGDALVKVDKFTHSYPHCWRCKNPLIYRATKQWFIAMDKEVDGDTLRNRALNEIKDVQFIPESGRNRLTSMVENRPDWCISRQRDWGVPIAFFRDKNSGEVILDDDVLENIYNIFTQKGADAWYDMSIAELLPKNSKYNPDDLEKVNDILDVWFDSGSTFSAVLQSGNYDAGSYPADMYLEGSDQHRGWFQSSLLVSTATNDKAPYKSILTHGFTVDENGEKMSKSKGNVVSPQEVTKKFGGEILRLWVAMSDYKGDIKISDTILKQIADQYRKLRNTIRILLANLEDMEEPNYNFSSIDRWILAESKKTFNEVIDLFKKYDFSKAFNILNNFVVNELSAIYVDVTKDRMYCEAKDSQKRRATQTAMCMIVKRLLIIIAPVLTYTADEAISHAPAVLKKDSIFDYEYQEFKEFDLTTSITDKVLEIRRKFGEVVDNLKKEKVIKSTLELNLCTSDSDLLDDSDLVDFFVVSDITTDSCGEKVGEIEFEGITYELRVATKSKCPRCWRYLAENENELCDRCREVVNG